METIDITPDPRVLIALTHTPMQPLDALCELIDNAFDSFHTARLAGHPVENPIVVVDLPTRGEINSGAGVVRVRDNGPGLNQEMLQNAIRAGYSSQNPYDTLGLFGLGFNISTGKLGVTTRLLAARSEDAEAIQVTVDLADISQTRTFQVPVSRFEKPKDFGHGAVVEVSNWWPEGSPNTGFVRKLVQYGMPLVRSEVGRRYATLLRDGAVRIVINGDACEPFSHCVWDDNRYVTRRGSGQIPATYRFNQLIGSQVRCSTCGALVTSGESRCESCGGSSLRTIEHRIEGWVGIQRFDDKERFGIDLVRNGRAIRIAEKSAFFEFTDEFKRTTVDYPIDNPYGRIVGEIQLDHVPVDFLKQDFQRSSPEWQEAMAFLRGTTSLQPGMVKSGEENGSPVFLLYQGYRRVRTPGKTDMYMGYWDPDEGKPKRISRDEEAEMYERFLRGDPGYIDDAEWWKKVEQADTPPVRGLVECPDCHAENLEGQETCLTCGAVLQGKTCVNPECASLIPVSAVTCPNCSESQIPEVSEPWLCHVCGHANGPDAEACSECSAPRGALDPLSRDYLLEHSNKSDELSLSGVSIRLADGSNSNPLDVAVYVTNGAITSPRQQESVPCIIFRGESTELFLDKAHPMFRSYQLKPEHAVATEIANFLFDAYRGLSSDQYRAMHNVSMLSFSLLDQRWRDQLRETPEQLRERVVQFFSSLEDRLVQLLGPAAPGVFDELTDDAKRHLVDTMMGRGLDVGTLPAMVESGAFLKYLDPDSICGVFERHPQDFFDGGLWRETYAEIIGLSSELVARTQQRLRDTYLSCLLDLARYLTYTEPEAVVVQRVRSSLDFVLQKIV